MTTNDKTVGDERAAFEAWASDDGQYPKAVQRNGDGYLLSITQSYWSAWQACAECLGATEAAEILRSLIENIERDGMYSQESTLGFLSQAYYCLRPANRAASLTTPSKETAGAVALNPGSPEASAMIDSVLNEYGWPCNPKNAARAGFVAAQRLAAPGAAIDAREQEKTND